MLPAERPIGDRLRADRPRDKRPIGAHLPLARGMIRPADRAAPIPAA